MKTIMLAALMGVVSWLMTAGALAQGSPKDQTIQDLQAAFTGESNAAVRYAAFAAKADQEGFAQAASLFRAAARAEQIHAANHAKVLKELGAEAKAEKQQPQVGSTQENLKAAIAGESQERDTMYPQFIKNARDASLADAVRTFTQARTAEAEHAKLYAAMLEGVDQGQKQAKTQFIVCPVCGYTAASLDGKCPSCFTPKDRFEVIS